MKKTIRLTAVLTALCLLLCCLPVSVFAGNLPFLDVAKGSWYYEAVGYCYTNKLITGTSATTFSPNMQLTRAMATVILYNASGNYAKGSYSYPDVSAGSWYYDAVSWAKKSGVVSGYSDGKFHPNDPIPREQLLCLLYRYAGNPAVSSDLSLYADGSSTASYAKAAVGWACAVGLISSTDTYTMRCNPKGTATRAEFAVMMMNFQESDRSTWGIADRTLRQTELTQMENQLMSVTYNGFATCEYYGAANVPLDWVLYNYGTSSTLSTGERSLLIAQWGDIDTDVFKLTTAQITSFVNQATGLSLSEMKKPLTWLYLPTYDAYYSMHGDTNMEQLQCLSGKVWGNGSAKSTYLTLIVTGSGNSIFYRTAANDYGEASKMQLTLRISGSNMYFVSCAPVK